MEISVSKLQNPLTHWPPWPLKNVRIKTFESEQALEDAVLASACVWPFPPQYVAGVGWCALNPTQELSCRLVPAILEGSIAFILGVLFAGASMACTAILS